MRHTLELYQQNINEFAQTAYNTKYRIYYDLYVLLFSRLTHEEYMVLSVNQLVYSDLL